MNLQNPPESRFGRPADSKKRIVRALRARIVDGELAPGSRLPTRVEIERQFGAGPMTVQRALDQLALDGFVTVQGKRGTYVADSPPHLSRYAVVFMQQFSRAQGGSRFFEALRAEVDNAHDTRRWDLPQFFNVDGHEDSEDYQRLVREVLADRVAGLIFASNPYPLRGTPLLDKPGIPRVAIMDESAEAFWPIVSTDMESFLLRSLDYVASRGRRRVAFLNPTGLAGTWKEDSLPALLRERELTTHPWWLQAANLVTPETARNCVHLLMHCQERPDALVISDDNLVESAVAGLLDAGMRSPRDVEVVAHSNFPYPTTSLVPAKRLGFDVRLIVQKCIERIDGQRAGEEVPKVTTIGAQFEDEVASAQ